MALWGGRFTDSRSTVQTVQRLVALRLSSGGAGYRWLCRRSKALVTVGVLSAAEQQQLEEALNVLLEEVRANPQQILASDAEDIHSWVEGKLIDKVGQLGETAHRAQP